ncbi:MAG: hypothetical protein R3B91_23680 [Planctomycetaceae bacterium]
MMGEEQIAEQSDSRRDCHEQAREQSHPIVAQMSTDPEHEKGGDRVSRPLSPPGIPQPQKGSDPDADTGKVPTCKPSLVEDVHLIEKFRHRFKAGER